MYQRPMMRLIDRIGAWVTHHVVGVDPNPQPGRLEIEERKRQVADVMMRQVDSAARANRAVCDERRDASPGVFYSCTLTPGHGARRLATGAMDARARKDAAEMEAELLAVLDIGRTANLLRDADPAAVDYALAAMLDDNPDLAALLHEGGEDR